MNYNVFMYNFLCYDVLIYIYIYIYIYYIYIYIYYIYIYIYNLFKETSLIFRFLQIFNGLFFYLVIIQLVYTFLHFLFVTFLWFVRFEISLILKLVYIYRLFHERQAIIRDRAHAHLEMSRWAKKFLPNKQIARLDFLFLTSPTKKRKI